MQFHKWFTSFESPSTAQTRIPAAHSLVRKAHASAVGVQLVQIFIHGPLLSHIYSCPIANQVHPPPTSYASDFTSPVTFSSISLSDSPANSSLFSLPKSTKLVVSILLSYIYALCPIDPFSMADVVLTVAGENLRLCPCRLADHDWRGRVVLLHRGVSACEKRSVSFIESANILNCLHASAAGIQLHPGGRNGCPEKQRSRDWGAVPRRIARLASLAQQESHLLEALGECVFTRHGDQLYA